MRWHLAILIALAAALYFYQLGRADIVTDESSHAVRAIGLVDFDFGIEQPTPWQWVRGMPPWWMHVSFHDHPPILFLAQHVSIRLFGETPFAARVPSAVAGIASVVLLYLIGTRLYSPAVGAISSSLFTVTVNHAWISRIGLFESVLIAFMLASTIAFLKAIAGPASLLYDRTKVMQGPKLDKANPKFLLLSAAFLGLAFLTKYTSLILVPIFGSLLLLRWLHRQQIEQAYWPKIMLAVLLFLVVASPVIIYNLQLYRNFGHFDFQFSLLFGQDVEAWQSRPGQEVLGSYADRIKSFIPWLIRSNSPYFLILAGLGLAVMLWQAIRNRWRSHGVMLLALAWLLPYLVFIGPAPRFLSILTPWLALAAGVAIASIGHSNILKNVGMSSAITVVTVAAVAAFISFEAFYAYQSVIALNPRGPAPWVYAATLRRQSANWGFNQLEEYLANELAGKMPDPAITFEFPFARDILDKSRTEGSRRDLEPIPLGIVYNDNINLSATLWTFLRRITYHGWPMTSAEEFRRGGADQFFRESGVKRVIFINATPAALQDRSRADTPDGDLLESLLRSKGATPVEIKNARGEAAFRAYTFDL